MAAITETIYDHLTVTETRALSLRLGRRTPFGLIARRMSLPSRAEAKASVANGMHKLRVAGFTESEVMQHYRTR